MSDPLKEAEEISRNTKFGPKLAPKPAAPAPKIATTTEWVDAGAGSSDETDEDETPTPLSAPKPKAPAPAPAPVAGPTLSVASANLAEAERRVQGVVVNPAHSARTFGPAPVAAPAPAAAPAPPAHGQAPKYELGAFVGCPGGLSGRVTGVYVTLDEAMGDPEVVPHGLKVLRGVAGHGTHTPGCRYFYKIQSNALQFPLVVGELDGRLISQPSRS